MIVLDASVALCVGLGEPSAALVEDRLRGWLRGGERLIVPSPFWLEVVNTLRIRGRMSGGAIVEAVHYLDTFDLETVDLDRPHLLLVVDAVEHHGLTGYDASYLVLAELLDASLATFDRPLAAAAGGRWIPVDRPTGVHEARIAYPSEPTWPDYSGLGAFLSRLRAAAQDGLEASPARR
jgi:predicted nucleic acid-binding protein